MKVAPLKGGLAAVVTPTKSPTANQAQSANDQSKLSPVATSQPDSRADPSTLSQKQLAKRGPRKSASDLKTELIGANCTGAEYNLIKSAARLVGLKPGRFLIDCALRKTAEIIDSHDLCVETRMEQILVKSLQRQQAVEEQGP